jgi:uncharacterized protein
LAVLVATTLLAACATSWEGAYRGAATTSIWKVKGQSNTIYLLASIHVLSQQAYPLKPAMEEAYRDSARVVFEVNPTTLTAKGILEEFRRTGAYPEGDSIVNHVSPDTVKLIRQLLPAFGLDFERAQRLRPWFLAEMLNARLLEKAGFSSRLGVDLHFYRRALRDGKNVLGLESIRDQAIIFDRYSDRQNEEYLLSGIAALPSSPFWMAVMVAAWREGRTDLLDRMLNDHQKQDPRAFSVVFSARNQKWLPQITEFARQPNNVLVIVGAGHLVGRHGLVALLRRNGYDVEQL